MHAPERAYGSLLGGLFGPEVLVAAAPPTGELASLLPAERPAVEGAVASRQREFATGRVCARAILARFGVHGTAVPRHHDGAPQWPDGFVGSIAHTRDLCVAVVARRSDVRSLGVDVERDADLDADLWDIVFADRERVWLMRQPPAVRSRLATAVFSAKECTYKCLYPWLRAAFAPRQIEVHWDGRAATFAASVGSAIPRDVAMSLVGSIARRARWVVAGMSL